MKIIMENDTSLPYSISMTFIEAPLFSKLVYDYLSEDEYAALQWTLAARPETGKVIPGSGGLRKVRWAAKGKGKRGGTRIIYLYQKEYQIWLITIYAKNEVDSIPAKTLKAIKEALGK
jgi:mRNA-degrading endonuclease RelE of RelBE toxin-antitoxin system